MIVMDINHSEYIKTIKCRFVGYLVYMSTWLKDKRV